MVFGRGGSSVPRRPMKYPYTMSAKIAQFPFKFYFKNSWAFRYYMFGVVASMPFFYWMQSIACSPENTQKWKELRRKEKEEALEHLH